MSTLSEIEDALPTLSTDELVRLEDLLDLTLRTRRKVFTGYDAVRWWKDHERMPVEDADAFAADLDQARGEANRPPSERRWE